MSLSTTLSRKREADGDRSVTRLVTAGREMFHGVEPDHSSSGDVLLLDEKGGPMFEAALALTTALTLLNGAKPAALSQALADAARQHLIITVAAVPFVCRMPVIPSEGASDQRFIVIPRPSPQPAKMPSVGKLLPCPAVGNR